ncbi:Serine/threonine-protein kinase smg1 [Quaeritorhiza haematococci]|nr:Serine/threonine-protein kinase smg1 [Quaeritorhiza haematococci]
MKKGTVKDVDGWCDDVENLVADIADAFVSLHDPDPIIGLDAWCRKELGAYLEPRRQAAQDDSDDGRDTSIVLPSLKVAALMSEERFEPAIEIANDSLKTLLHDQKTDQRHTQQISSFVKQITECYLSLNDWDSMSQWIELLQTWGKAYQTVDGVDSDTFDPGYPFEYLQSWTALGLENDKNGKSDAMSREMDRWMARDRDGKSVHPAVSMHGLLHLGYNEASLRAVDEQLLESLLCIKGRSTATSTTESSIPSWEGITHSLNQTSSLINEALASFSGGGGASSSYLSSETELYEVAPALVRSNLLRTVSQAADFLKSGDSNGGDKALHSSFAFGSSRSKAGVGAALGNGKLFPDNHVFVDIKTLNHAHRILKTVDSILQQRSGSGEDEMAPSPTNEYPQLSSLEKLPVLQFSIARSARQRGNFMLASRLLQDLKTTVQSPHEQSSVASASSSASTSSSLLALRLEQAKLSFAMGQGLSGISSLLDVIEATPSLSVATSYEQYAVGAKEFAPPPFALDSTRSSPEGASVGPATESETVRDKITSELKARAFIKLGQWCRSLKLETTPSSSSSSSSSSSPTNPQVARVLERCLATLHSSEREELHLPAASSTSSDDDDKAASGTPSEKLSSAVKMDRLAECYLQKATEESPHSVKAWFEYANFCYRLGRKGLEQILGQRGNGPISDLLEEAARIIFEDSDGVDTKQAAKLLRATILTVLGESSGDADVKNTEVTTWTDSESFIASRLCKDFPTTPKEILSKVTKILDTIIQQDVLQNFERAAHGYFKFLTLSSPTMEETQETCHTKCKNITATLRILRLFVKYGVHLEQTFQIGFEDTTVMPWENVIPQLFARLDHPEPLIGNQVCKLICKIGQASPHLIVYNAVVGSLSQRMSASDQSRRLYRTILASLRMNGTASLVQEVEKTIKELQRVTVLWEELWLNKLGHLSSDVGKRIERLRTELERVQSNTALSDAEREKIIHENYQAITRPLVISIQKLCATTVLTPPSTPHEKWFQKTYGVRIQKGLAQLIRPEGNPSLKETWTPFKEIYRDLSQEFQKNRVLKVSDVSPYLGQSQDSLIPVPGLPIGDDIVTIKSFGDQMHVLPTKTKPKRINLIGSNNRCYTYLFKGLEDLHLDERIMQFVRTVNQLLLQDKETARRQMEARNYSVIPFGDHFGMIQWVDNMTGLFTLYKRWQDSVRLLQRKDAPTPAGEHANANDGNHTATNTPVRPHDLYYSKVTAALKRHGISSNTPRKNWPIAVMREVFQELVAETPSNLIGRELWYSSATPASWWEKSKRFSRSVAVMSIVGYVIGLGDRHLDNILLDITTGDILHIDYNVCFEKGRKLRVPETVPFRLSQNLQGALGLTGIEGVFRIACENTMRVMRKNKEVLLTLLEAFVYDPLVDWTNELADEYEKRVVELNVNLSLLSSRIAESKAPLSEHQSRLIALCEKAETSLEELTTGKKAGAVHLVRSSVDSGEPPKMEFLVLRDALHKRLSECMLWLTQHEQALRLLNGPFLQTVGAEVLAMDSTNLFTPFVHVTYMLGLDESLMIRCMEIDQDLFRLSGERTMCYRSCMEHLNFYQALMAPVVDRLLAQDYFKKWKDILERFVKSEFAATDYAEVYAQLVENLESDYNEKSAVEDMMAAVFAEKEIEIRDLADLTSKLAQGKDQSDETARRIQVCVAGSTRRSAAAGSALVYGAVLFGIAEVGHLLMMHIKEPTKIGGDAWSANMVACVRSLAADYRILNRKYPFQPDHFEDLCALISLASVYVNALRGTSLDGDLDIDAESSALLEHFSLLARAMQELHVHVTDVIFAELFRPLVSQESTTITDLLAALSAIQTKAEMDIDQKSAEFQQLAHEMVRVVLVLKHIQASLGYVYSWTLLTVSVILFSQKQEYAALHATIAAQSNRAAILLSSMDAFFVNLQNLIFGTKAAEQTHDAAERSMIENALFVRKMKVFTDLLAGCLDYYSACQHRVAGSIQDWLHFIDAVTVIKDDAFTAARSQLRRYLDMCIRETLLKPSVKLIGKLVKRLTSATPAAISPMTAAADRAIDASGLEKTGIAFVDGARKVVSHLLNIGHTGVDEVMALDGLLWQQALQQVESSLMNEALVRLHGSEASLTGRKMSLLRFRTLNEKALTSQKRDLPAESQTLYMFRLQFIENLQNVVKQLVQYDSHVRSVEKQCQMIEAEMGPLLSQMAANPTTAGAVHNFAEFSRNRHGQFLAETQRNQSMLELCHSLIHFECFRVPNENTKTMDDDTLSMIHRLEWMESERKQLSPQQSTPSPQTNDGAKFVFPPILGKASAQMKEIVGEVVEDARTLEGEIQSAKPTVQGLGNMIDEILQSADDLAQTNEVFTSLKEFGPDWVRLCEEITKYLNAALLLEGQLHEPESMSSEVSALVSQTLVNTRPTSSACLPFY